MGREEKQGKKVRPGNYARDDQTLSSAGQERDEKQIGKRSEVRQAQKAGGS